jgi:peroxiredoxin
VLNRLLLSTLLLSALSAGCITYQPQAAFDPELTARLDRLEKLLVEQTSPAATPEARLARIEAQLSAETKLLNQSVDAKSEDAQNALPDAVIQRSPEVAFDGWSSGKQKMGEKLLEKFAETSTKGMESNRVELLGAALPQRRFIGPSGEIVDLDDFKGSKRMVIVFMRGFSGQICIGCSSQTLALMGAKEKFDDRNAQVIVVFPGSSASVPAFLDSIKALPGGQDSLPFPVLLDVNLNAVKTLDIKGSLAKPTSIIVDEGGVVRYIYAGKSFDDRPSVKTLLAELDALPAAVAQ